MNYTNINYGFNDTELNPIQLPTVQAGDVFTKCNFSRKLSGTFLFDDIQIYFIDCNLSGVDIKPSWVVDEQCFIGQLDWDLTPQPIVLPTITWGTP